jgi:hypothetical protein
VTAFDALGTAGGSVAVAADGSFTYTAAADYNGDDTFSYTITDSDGDTDTATVTVTVAATDDTLTAADDAYAATEDTLLTVLAGSGVLANDTLGDTPTTVTSFDATGTAGGAVAVAADGSFT